ncbi:MAG: Gfo/Idh/MocA family oxidoreductase [Acidobacteria bacterium]|nr:Gfo/Idh/MocA family oxidoreductase [Acidobacteriota bacterium]
MTDISRRQFLGAAGAATGFTIVPRRVLGGRGQVAPSSKINVAFIGVGAQGLRVMLNFLRQPDVQGVAVCDPNKGSAGYPQWSDREFSTGVHTLLGVESGWEWLSPNDRIQLTHTTTATSGIAGREPCQKIVNAYYARGQRAGEYRGCRAYADYRELLEKERDVDAVVVCTVDHWHAPIAIAAMKKGRHVFCQKPMTHTVAEARRMAEVARESGVATTVAIGNQASEATRLICEWVWAGAIGPVRQVANWSSRPFWPHGLDRPSQSEPVPEGLDWNLWLGPAPERPFHHVYLPFVWRGWFDFGGGSLGDMGGYSFDTIFRVLKLEAPASVEASSTERFPETFPHASIVHYDFPARGDLPPVRLSWYDGRLKPPRPAELDGGADLADEGLLFVGDKGSILCGFNGQNPKLIPQAKMDAFVPPPRTLPRSPGNDREWLDACLGGKTKPGANFEFEGRVTEALLLGNVALRTGRRILWDPANLKAIDLPAADAYIQPPYRSGWTSSA